jgi:TRAP-type mannitol/chloroaromatic compound transport system substrate-binding protein
MQWAWVGGAAARVEQLVRSEQWDQLPQQMITLLKHFSDITITRFTRTAEAWEGAYEKLLKETPPTR